MIDINSGSKINYEGDKSSLDMIYEVNLNATNAIIEQLHLKNMYGIIIIDYINMNKEYLRIKLTDYLRTLSLNDRGLIRIHNMTEESLVTLIKESKNVVQNYNEEERLF